MLTYQKNLKHTKLTTLWVMSLKLDISNGHLNKGGS